MKNWLLPGLGPALAMPTTPAVSNFRSPISSSHWKPGVPAEVPVGSPAWTTKPGTTRKNVVPSYHPSRARKMKLLTLSGAWAAKSSIAMSPLGVRMVATYWRAGSVWGAGGPLYRRGPQRARASGPRRRREGKGFVWDLSISHPECGVVRGGGVYGVGRRRAVRGRLQKGQADQRAQALIGNPPLVRGIHPTVDNERRGPRQPHRHGLLILPHHPGLEGVFLQVPVEPLHVQPQFLRITGQHLRHLGGGESGPFPLPPEDQVVHLPELPLSPGGFGGLGRDLGLVVDAGEREMPVDDAQMVFVRF